MRKEYVQSMYENIKENFKDYSVQLVVSNELIRMSNVEYCTKKEDRCTIEEFNSFIFELQNYLMGNFDLTIDGSNGVTIVAQLKKDIDPDSFKKHHTLTTKLGIL